MTGVMDSPILVADIGGTKARFALSAAGPGRGPHLWAMHEFWVDHFDSLAEAIQYYLTRLHEPLPRRAVIAVASPVTGGHIQFSNSPWSFSIAALQAEAGLEKLEVINDFAALGRAIPYLEAADLRAIGAVPEPLLHDEHERQCAVLGPGTGLGVCRIVLRQGPPLVLETEGGHIGFAPADAYEAAILAFLLRRYPRVSVERLISGPGLENLHAAVCTIDDSPRSAGGPVEIIAGAQRGEATCTRAVELFCSILGSFAGDVALLHGAWHGLYLGGGMTARLLPWIRNGAFRQRFEAKGRFEALMRGIPTHAITHAQPGLLGAAACALDGFRS